MWVRFLIAVWLSALSLAATADECLPSEWGAADQIGAANRITPERTIAAAALVKKGASHPLGIVITPGMPAYPPRTTQLQVVQPDLHFRSEGSYKYGWKVSTNDDLVQMWLGTGPQICLLYTSPSPRDRQKSRMPSSA